MTPTLICTDQGRLQLQSNSNSSHVFFRNCAFRKQTGAALCGASLSGFPTKTINFFFHQSRLLFTLNLPKSRFRHDAAHKRNELIGTRILGTASLSLSGQPPVMTFSSPTRDAPPPRATSYGSPCLFPNPRKTTAKLRSAKDCILNDCV